MRLGELIRQTDARVVRPEGGEGVVVTSVTDDSRAVEPGGLFVARPGTKVDGARFIEQAIGAGARAILCAPGAASGVAEGVVVVESAEVARTAAVVAERFYGSPTHRLGLVGITGTNGKTTTAHLVWHLLNAAGVRCGQIGTVTIDAGAGPERATMTTPGAIELSRRMAGMVERGVRACAMEVSSHALDQRRAAGLAFDVGVFTNLTGEHLDYHKTMDAYARAKRRLFEMLPADGLAVVNTDDPRGAEMAGASGAPVAACSGSDGGAAWFVRAVASFVDGASLEIRGPEYELRERVGLPGAYNAMNACQAAAAADGILTRLGWDAPARARAIGRGLRTAGSPLGRMERVPASAGQPTVIVDYAHTDDAIGRALGAVRGAMAPGARLWIVFGPGGDKDPTKRPRMGAAAAAHADTIVLTSDNPRTEPIEQIFAHVLDGVPAEARGRVVLEPDRARAIRVAIEGAGADDVVLLAGKGHEREQVYSDGRGGTRREAFSDPDVARAVLAELESRGQGVMA